MRTQALLVTLLVVWVAVGQARAQAPSTITYQGRLVDGDGAPITTAVTVVFSIYATDSGGTAVWSESQSVSPDTQGVFTAELGASTPLSTAIFDGAKRYLGIRVGADPEMVPRQIITAVPYALRAAAAPSAADNDWTISGSNVYRATGNVGIGTTAPGARLQVQGDTTHYISTQVNQAAYHEFRSGANTWEAGLNFGDSGFWYMISNGANDWLQIHQSGILNLYCDPVYLRTVYGHGISGTTRDLYITSAGELGYLTSSLRYKENVRPLHEYSKRIYGLRPVVFDYKGEGGKNQFGLIAEEVEKVMPELVGYDEEGRPDTVSYDQLVPLLLNEVIQLKRQNDQLAERVRRLEGDPGRETR